MRLEKPNAIFPEILRERLWSILHSTDFFSRSWHERLKTSLLVFRDLDRVVDIYDGFLEI